MIISFLEFAEFSESYTPFRKILQWGGKGEEGLGVEDLGEDLGVVGCLGGEDRLSLEVGCWITSSIKNINFSKNCFKGILINHIFGYF